MLKKVAQYGNPKKREDNSQSHGVVENVETKTKRVKKKTYKQDVFNPFSIYDYDIEYEEG